MKSSRTFAFRVLGIVHIVVGALLLLVATLFGSIVAPILALGPLWVMVLGFRMWTPGAHVITLLRRTHLVSLVLAVLLVAYGILALQAAERSAAAGGGLLGAFGLLPLGLGVVLGSVAALSLWLAFHQSAN